jgi:hypothetical protein
VRAFGVILQRSLALEKALRERKELYGPQGSIRLRAVRADRKLALFASNTRIASNCNEMVGFGVERDWADGGCDVLLWSEGSFDNGNCEAHLGGDSRG